jgi:hypothetical protein
MSEAWTVRLVATQHGGRMANDQDQLSLDMRFMAITRKEIEERLSEARQMIQTAPRR